MSNETLYVRNWHPNVVIIRYADLKVPLQRRGSREDTAALPGEARSDRVIRRWLEQSVLEEITAEQFNRLTERDEEETFKLRSSINQVDIPIEDRRSDTPTVIDSKELEKNDFKQKFMSPKLEYFEEPLSTEEEYPTDYEEELNDDEETEVIAAKPAPKPPIKPTRPVTKPKTPRKPLGK